MSVIKKLIAAISLTTLLLNLGGCLPFMAVHAAKKVSEKANAPSDADAKKAEDANKSADPKVAPANAAPATTPAK